ncbi:MAG: hypothetical protein GWN87_33695, partial [Desulfuromonadales bacterium]|nr:hypothetical protein [Desulfuromonadales bacterium]NIS44398.1 hypothetical protein [Desulfuromonadales bacterium]
MASLDVATLVTTLQADIGQFERELKKAERRLDGLEGETKRAERGVGGLTRSARGLALVAGAGMGLSVAVRGMSSAVTSASNLNESINAVKVVFGDAADTILDFSGDTTDAVFEAESAVNQMAVKTGGLLQVYGLSQQEAADQTKLLTERAADLASVYNTTVEEALIAVNAALRGEQEPIRNFNVAIDEALVKAYALENGLAATTGEITLQDKALARLNLIMEQTAAVEGDAANTAGEFANQKRALGEQLEVVAVAFGEALIPAVEAAIPLLIEAADAALFFVGVLEGLPGVTSDTAREIAQLEREFGKLNQEASVDALGDFFGEGKVGRLEEAGVTLEELAAAIAEASTGASTGAVEFGEFRRELEETFAAKRPDLYRILAADLDLVFEAMTNVHTEAVQVDGALGDHVVAVTAADLGYQDLTDSADAAWRM